MCLFFKHRPMSMSMPMPMAMGDDDQEERELFHVLAIDDSVIDRKLIERLLQISSYKVTTVDSGIKALKLLGLQQEEINNCLPSPAASHLNTHEEKNVNLIITDYFMPEMTGYDLLRRIKDSEFYKDTPVVVMSSENIPSEITRCLESGAQEFILKPVRLSDVTKLRPHLLIRQQTTTTPQHTTITTTTTTTTTTTDL